MRGLVALPVLPFPTRVTRVCLGPSHARRADRPVVRRPLRSPGDGGRSGWQSPHRRIPAACQTHCGRSVPPRSSAAK
ncbi:hypothetical protein DTL36_01890 [Bremerella cremea]|nr:hypothetical protein DTL36_01890 [Bremerella cremea]